MIPEQVFEKIRPRLAAILRKDEALVTYEASLFDDLDAESIDLAEIEVVLEELYNVEVSDEQIEVYMMGEVTREDFYDEFYNVTDPGLKQLETVIPRFSADRWSGELNMYNLGHILTVDALCRFISEKSRATARIG